MLKLPQLPDRIPVKLTITLQPDMKKALDDYAAMYSRTYGADEPVAELIPFMLESFLKADAGFRKGRKDLDAEPMAIPLVRKKAKQRRASEGVNEEKGRKRPVYLSITHNSRLRSRLPVLYLLDVTGHARRPCFRVVDHASLRDTRRVWPTW